MKKELSASLRDPEVTARLIEMEEKYPFPGAVGGAGSMKGQRIREQNPIIYAALRDAITKEQVRVRMSLSNNRSASITLLERLDKLLAQTEELFPPADDAGKR